MGASDNAALRLAELSQGPAKAVWSFDARSSQDILNLLAAARASGVLSIPFHNGGPRGVLRFEQQSETPSENSVI